MDNQNYSSTNALGGCDETNRRLIESAKLTSMSAFRKLAEDRGFDLTDVGPSDDHIRAPAVCPRCEWDMALWGESVYDLTTGKHIAVENLMRRLIPRGGPMTAIEQIRERAAKRLDPLAFRNDRPGYNILDEQRRRFKARDRAQTVLDVAGVAALLDVAEAAQRVVTSASAHFRCPLCDKNGHGHTSACPVLALRTAFDLLPQQYPAKEG